MNRQEFVTKYGPVAKAATAGTGLFPETLFAQAIIESSDKKGNIGNSQLAKQYNNYFGIKADKKWKGKVVNMKTGEFTGTANATVITDGFRVYDSVEDSIRDYVKFLTDNPRYRNAGVFNASSPQEQGVLLQKAGYATGAGYGKLIGDVAKGVSRWLVGIEAEVKQQVKDEISDVKELVTNPIGLAKKKPAKVIIGVTVVTVSIALGIYVIGLVISRKKQQARISGTQAIGQ